MKDWRPVSEAREDGTRCYLRFRDALGYYEGKAECVLHEGRWYQIEPPMLIEGPVASWRPVDPNY